MIEPQDFPQFLDLVNRGGFAWRNLLGQDRDWARPGYLIVGDGTPAGWTKLAIGTAGQTLRVNSGATGLEWVSASPITNSLGADVALNNTANYFDGPSVAQGSTGTWFASGTVTVTDTAASAYFDAKLWDGTTVIASARTTTITLNDITSISLSGYLASPAGNLRISVKDVSLTTGKILYNSTGNSKDSTISAFRIA